MNVRIWRKELGRRSICSILLSAVLFIVGGGDLSAVVNKKEEAKTAVALAPELEAKLAEFLQKAREAKRAIWAEQAKKRLDDFAAAAGLEPERRKALQPPTEEAIERSLDEWAATGRDGWRKWAGQVAAQGPDIFEQILPQVDGYVRSDFFADYVRPLEQPKWTEALRTLLTPEQVASWERTEKERQEAVLKEIAEPFKVAAAGTRELLRTSLLKKSQGIKAALRLTDARAATLDALASSIADHAPEVWRTRATRNLIWMNDEHRREMLRAGFHINPDDKETARMETDWEEGVAKLLSPEETKRLRVTQDEYKERRSRALAKILLTQLDEQVAFTTVQRERLWPIAERGVKAERSLLPDAAEQSYYQINLQTLLACGRKATESELQAILDPIQRKRWDEACSGKNLVARSGIVLARQIVPAVKANPPARPVEPEDLENAISDHLHEKAVAEQKRLLAIHLLKAEDAARVAGLSAPSAALLSTAARGAMEEELAMWKTSTEQTIRGQLRDVTPENVQQRLAGLERFGTSRRSTGNSDQGALWAATVKAELTEAQQSAWQKELDARSAYRDTAIASLIMAEFDRRISLTTDQWRKLEPLIAAAVKDYGPDIGSMFSYSYGNTWYLLSHSMFVPVAAVPEKELKAVLTKTQLERWNGGGEFGNTVNYWENVQRIHTSRVKEKKE